MKISLIGSGNLAQHLAPALNKIGGVTIMQVISRDKSQAKNLAMQVKADYSDELSRLKPNFDMLLFAVSDDAIDEVLQQLEVPDNKILCHTAGSVSSRVLANYARRFGVIYPLQTFSRNKPVDWRDVPLFVTASDEGTEKRLLHLTRQLSKSTNVINDDQRFALHVSAVFACNFSNAVMAISQKLCEKHDLDFEWLHPLINETLGKAMRNGPKHSQTGPAKRADATVMARHLEFLATEPQEKAVYEVVSDFISSHFGNSKT